MGEIGGAWLHVVQELEDELHALDPAAAVIPSVRDTGLLRLRARIGAEHRGAALAACRRHERRANATCEDCGSPIQTVQAGAVVGILCPGCRRWGEA